MSAAAMTNLLALTGLLLQFTEQAAAMSRLLNTAHAEGRDVTREELDALFAGDDAARARLDAAIAAAGG
jgi:hypothetical protein